MDELMINEDLKKFNAKETAYKVIKSNILDLNLEPGLRIKESELEEKLKMSRTPIRDAISRLTSEGSIDVYPQSGTYISKIDLERVKESVFLRSTIETEAVKRACNNFTEKDFIFLDSNFKNQKLAVDNERLKEFSYHDNKLHEYFFLGNGFKYTWELINDFSFDYHRIRKLKLDLDLRTRDTLDEHKKLIKAIEERDIEKATKMVKNHIEYVYKDLEVLKGKFPAYFVS
ncbi:regulatory protein GntR, HTH [Halanaerobium saccharolyticum subsp. saccharolyticum DSM 6643]|uniref:Regulatory protein GntR, HTH n=1 Tax=Halanaerobium saccharolyticum subsp. saccharolyticum DSM 6643 TaxID=1293054 RepID=M5E303_9FIRM|nr:GntR family transcriptional regulator [Halanaerobium saccharolyticum]CCU80913.1 regulatory protein GntR, HTH [Halanaerobium saccharolyticum subsp. saccharolyticum DSM 6643]